VAGSFARDDGSTVELLAGYRDTIKASWRNRLWSTSALLELACRVELPSDAAALHQELQWSATLPLPSDEYASLIRDLAVEFPDELLDTGRVDADGGSVIEVAPRVESRARLATLYRGLAIHTIWSLRRVGVDASRARVLDVGTASGYLAYALAGAGVQEVVGVDLDPEGYVTPAARREMRAALCDGREDAVSLVRGDAHDLPFDDCSFDAVVSITCGEHLRDFEHAMRECYRVLRPGGIAHHSVEPWFGPRGGHALCTFDFPWGHVRLDGNEVARYLCTLRPHEADDALELWSEGFQEPRLTLDESRRAIVDAGFSMLRWREVPLEARSRHRPLATRALLADCRRTYPQVTLRDLMTLTYAATARR
jgi:SAM-dependent methyltransferase